MSETPMNIYQYNRRCPCTRCRMQGMTVPALLVTFGITLLLVHLNDWHGMHGNIIIPMLLIVFGAVRLLQYSASMEGHRQPVAYVPPVPVAPQTSSSHEEVNRG